MKRTYEKAEVTIIKLNGEDILTTSNQTPFAPYGNEDGEDA